MVVAKLLLMQLGGGAVQLENFVYTVFTYVVGGLLVIAIAKWLGIGE